MNNIDVSIYMPTYYHEKYVAAAIESVLRQKTHYSYEIVISDDGSQDNTVDIVRDYERRYPDIIRVSVNEENIGIPENLYKNRCMCRGRIIADLSGDDYWIDDNKIELQTKFLDEHPEYSALYNEVELRIDDQTTPYDRVPRNRQKLGTDYTIKDFEKCTPVGTHGFFMRNYFLTEEGREYFGQAKSISKYVDDAVDEVLLLRKGAVRITEYGAAVHRVASKKGHNYNSRYSKLDRFEQHIDFLNAMNDKWGNEIDFSGWYANYNAAGFLSMLYDRKFRQYVSILHKIPAEIRRPFKKGFHTKTLSFINEIIRTRLLRHKWHTHKQS